MAHRTTIYIRQDLWDRFVPHRNYINLSNVCAEAIEKAIFDIESGVSPTPKISDEVMEQIIAELKRRGLVGQREIIPANLAWPIEVEKCQ